MPTVDELNTRIDKLEKSKDSSVRFLVQYLLSPLIVVLIGFWFNVQHDRDQKNFRNIELELKRIEAAQDIIKELFSGTPERALIAESLLTKILDTKLSEEIHKIVQGYYKQSLEQSQLSTKDVEKTRQTIAVAKAVGGETGRNLVKAFEEAKFYVVAASAGSKDAAIRQREELRNKGYSSEAFRTPAGSYAVTLAHGTFEEAVSQKTKAIQAGIVKDDAWLSQGKSWLEKVSP